MLDIAMSYAAIRNTAGVYARGESVLSISGPDRHSFVQFLLARSIEFAATNTCVDSILLNDVGRPVGVATAVIGEERIDLVVDAPQEWFDLAARIQEKYDIVVDSSTFHAFEIEGPLAWKAVTPLVMDRDISDVLLHECLEIELDGVDVRMARAGTTAEYGYLLLASSASTAETLQALAQSVGGDLITPEVLSRIHVEINFPVLPEQLKDVSLFECGLPWMATLTRTDIFLGMEKLVIAPPSIRTVAVSFPGHDCPRVGAAVLVDGENVGVISVSTPRAGLPDGLGLCLLQDPFGVPGVSVDVEGIEGLTLSRPVIDPLSWSQEIGVTV